MAARSAFEIAWFEKIEKVQAEDVENQVGGVHRKGAFVAEDIMDVRLGKPGHAGKAALRQFSAADQFTDAIHQALLEFQEVHLCFTLFLPAIERNGTLKGIPENPLYLLLRVH